MKASAAEQGVTDPFRILLLPLPMVYMFPWNVGHQDFKGPAIRITDGSNPYVLPELTDVFGVQRKSPVLYRLAQWLGPRPT